MSPHVAARTAVVFGLLLGGAVAHADRRHVAVVDLTGGDPAAVELAAKLRSELIQHDELQPVSDVSAEEALKGPFLDEDGEKLLAARQDKTNADENLLISDFKRAGQLAIDGRDKLLGVTPSQAVIIHADLALALGQARVGEGKLAEAVAAFALTHRLNPSFTIDPSRFYPDVINAFEDATKLTAGTGTIVVHGSGEIWLDGKDVGPAPREDLTAAEGIHIVQLTGPERVTHGAVVVVQVGKPIDAVIAEDPAPVPLQIRRVRAALASAPDAAAHASLMAQLAKLIAVGDAVLLTKVDGKLLVQTWRDRAPGFSSLQQQGPKQPLDLLSPLSPPKPKIVVIPVPQLPPIVSLRWYEKRTVQVSIAAGVVATIVAGIFIARAGTKFLGLDQNVQYIP